MIATPLPPPDLRAQIDAALTRLHSENERLLGLKAELIAQLADAEQQLEAALQSFRASESLKRGYMDMCEELSAKLAKAHEALKPFADRADYFDAHATSDYGPTIGARLVRDCRRARAELAPTPPPGEPDGK